MSNVGAALIDESITGDHRLVQCDALARLLYLEAFVWAKGHETDGEVPEYMLRRITPEADDVTAGLLVAADLWSIVEPGLYMIERFTIEQGGRQWSAKRLTEHRKAGAVRFARHDKKDLTPLSNVTDPNRIGKGVRQRRRVAAATPARAVADEAEAERVNSWISECLACQSESGSHERHVAEGRVQPVGHDCKVLSNGKPCQHWSAVGGPFCLDGCGHERYADPQWRAISPAMTRI